MEIPNEETMLYRYSCRDMGLNCPFVAKAETLEEVTRMALEHVQAQHTADFNNINTPAEIERMTLSLSRSTRVVTG